MRDWDPQVGKHAMYKHNECMVIAEHNGEFWCKFKNGCLQTWSKSDLSSPPETDEELTNYAICSVFEVHHPRDLHCADRNIVSKMILAGYRKIEPLGSEVTMCCEDLFVDGYELTLKGGSLKAYDNVYKRLKLKGVE